MTYIEYHYNIIMNEISFEWDENKNQINIRKHQVSFDEAKSVSFDEAKSVFLDEEALFRDDPDLS